MYVSQKYFIFFSISEPLEENSFLGAMFSDLFEEPPLESQRHAQMAAVKDSKMTCGRHSRQTAFNPLWQPHGPCSSLHNHENESRTAKLCSIGETCSSDMTITSNSACFSSAAAAKCFSRNSGIAFEAFSPPRERTLSQLTSGSELECDLEEDDAIPVVLDIKNLKGVYQKKTRKAATGFEHRLVNSKVNMTLTAQAQIRCVKCHVRRCREAAKRTHDTIGKGNMI